MFTQDEAGALLLAGKLVEKMTDKSIKQAYTSALLKIKSVLHSEEKDHLQQLESNVEVFLRGKPEGTATTEFPDHFLTAIQRAVAAKKVLKILYTNSAGESSRRELEPLGVSYYGMAWHLIGWCRLRQEYRDFRSDRIRDLTETGQAFEGSHISLQEYFQRMREAHGGLIPVVVTFRKDGLRGRPLYGCIQQTDLGDRIRAEFMLDNLGWMSRWLLMFGNAAEVESPDELKNLLANLIEELREHHVTPQLVARETS